jgi:SNF2-related domain
MSITYERHDAYYDLHVPEHENYIAHGLCNHNTGMGKTLLSLALIRYFQRLGSIGAALALIPNKTNKAEWAREIRKHTQMNYVILEGSTADKWAQIEASGDTGRDDAADIFIETYGGMVHLLSKAVPDVKKRRKGKEDAEKLAPDEALCKRLGKRVQAVVFDESTFMSKRQTLYYRFARRLMKKAVLGIELTGTPFGRDPQALWSQIRLLDDGHSLGETLGLYRAAFFTGKQEYWGGVKWTFDDSKSDELHRCLKHRTINVEADKADLPDVTHELIKVTLPSATWQQLEIAKKAFQSGYKGRNGQAMKNAFLRLRQISSGFVGFEDDDGKAELVFPDNPKLDALMSYIERIDQAHKIIIYHDFKPSGKMLAERCEALKRKFVRIWSGTKDPERELLRFVNDDSDYTICLLSNAAGAYGLNLQIARYGLMYESPVGAVQRKQAERRFIRQHSTVKKKFLIDFVVKGTADERILDFHREGRDLFAAIIKGDVDLGE